MSTPTNAFQPIKIRSYPIRITVPWNYGQVPHELEQAMWQANNYKPYEPTTSRAEHEEMQVIFARMTRPLEISLPLSIEKDGTLAIDWAALREEAIKAQSNQQDRTRT